MVNLEEKHKIGLLKFTLVRYNYLIKRWLSVMTRIKPEKSGNIRKYYICIMMSV